MLDPEMESLLAGEDIPGVDPDSPAGHEHRERLARIAFWKVKAAEQPLTDDQVIRVVGLLRA